MLEPSLPIEQGCRDKIFRRIALSKVGSTRPWPFLVIPVKNISYSLLNLARESTLLMEFEPLEVNYKSSTPHLDHPLNQLPKIKLFGDEKVVSRLQKCLNQNIAQWNPSHSLKQNLETVLSLTLPSKPSAKLSDHLLDTAHTCGMCFSYSLNDCVPEVLCLNEVCGRTFHTACALEWLQSLPTTRRTFDMIVGDCPYW